MGTKDEGEFESSNEMLVNERKGRKGWRGDGDGLWKEKVELNFLLLVLQRLHARMRASLRLLSKWETVIGLELHIQIKSPTKLFSGKLS